MTEISDATLCIDADGRIVYANERGCSWLDCRPEQLSTLFFFALAASGAKISWPELWLRLRTCGSCTLELESPAGAADRRTAQVTLHYFRCREQELAIALLRGITAKSNGQTSPFCNQANAQAIFQGVETGIFIIDPETHRIVDANPVALRLIGAPPEETAGAVCHRFVCPAEAGHCPVTDLGQTVDNSERILLTARGERLSIIKTVRPIDLDGHHYLIESFFDVTEQKRSEKALAQRTSYLNALIETNPLGTVVLDNREHVEMLNSAFE